MQSADKKYFGQVKGINTEAPLVAWPEGFSIDEQNFDLLPDGSRRRRLGLSGETDGPFPIGYNYSLWHIGTGTTAAPTGITNPDLYNLSGSAVFGMTRDADNNLYFVDGNRVMKWTKATNLISTYAGSATNVSGNTGMGGLATAALLNAPRGLALELATGNLYIADNLNYRICLVTASTGIITSIAGTGTYGNSGDGGLATAATLSAEHIALDQLGNLYLHGVAPTFQYRLRKIVLGTGIITLAAGGGGTSEVNWTAAGLIGSSCRLNVAGGMACDSSGVVYISRTGTTANICKYDPADGKMKWFLGSHTNLGRTTVSGTLAADIDDYNGYGIYIGKKNGLDCMWLTVNSGTRFEIWSCMIATTIVTILAGSTTATQNLDGGIALNTLYAGPNGIAVDTTEQVYFSDSTNWRIYKITGLPEQFDGSTTDSSCQTRVYRWRDVNNIPDRNYIVAQVGSQLHMWIEPSSGPLGEMDYIVELASYASKYNDSFASTTYTSTAAQIKTALCDFTQINGKLIVVNPYVETLLITYEPSDDTLSIDPIVVKERDLRGVPPEQSLTAQPITLSKSHEYNLWNEGWNKDKISQYFTAKGRYPAENMICYVGMRRQASATYADNDAIKSFTPDGLTSEIFGNMAAPKGAIIREVFNWREGFSAALEGSGYEVQIESATVGAFNIPADTTFSFTCKSVAHGLVATDQIRLSNVAIRWRKFGNHHKFWIFYDGTWLVDSVPDADHFIIKFPTRMTNDNSEDTAIQIVLGTWADLMGGTEAYNQWTGAGPAETRFSATTAAFGRVFYAGALDDRLSNRVYFSKIAESDSDLAVCYQQADPTSEFVSNLLPNDGGVIVIPEAGIIRSVVAYGAFVLVFAANGVWAIGPGQEGIFTAAGYSLYQVTTAGCLSPNSIVLAEGSPMFWSEDGIWEISVDKDQRKLVANNLTKNVINGLYASIRYQELTRAFGSYDPIRKRVMWLYNSRLTTPITATPPLTGANMVQTTPVTPIGVVDDTDTTQITYDSILLFDLRLGAWTRWVLGTASDYKYRNIFAMPSSYITDNENRVRIFAQKMSGTDTDKTRYGFLEFNSTAYADIDAEAEAFVYTGPDSVGEPERHRTAPYVHVFMRRQSNGGVYMQPRWDWARGSDSGKMGNYINVYREIKPNTTAYGLVVTKNKIRGRGRNLFLAFKAGAGKDAWIDGWTIKYDASMRL